MDVSADLGSRHEVGDFGGVQLSLVEEPEMVAKLDIKYATTAKRLDVRVLKDSIWTELCEGDVDSQESEKSVLEGGKSLQRVVSDTSTHPCTDVHTCHPNFPFPIVPSSTSKISSQDTFLCPPFLSKPNNRPLFSPPL